MKTTRTRLGLSILAGGLSFVGGANAIDLITNGSFENPNGGEWKFFAVYDHSTFYFTGPQIPSSEGPGSKFSWKHASASGAWGNFVTPTNETDHLQFNLQWADSQTVNLTNAITGTAIDGALGQYTFSSWLASYGSPNTNPEQPYLVLRFFDNTGTNQIGTQVVFDRTKNVNAVTYADGTTTIPDDVSADHSWIKYVASGTLPAGARKATVYITRSPNAGLSGTPDTYVDLVKLDVINVNDTTVFDSSFPANGQSNVAADAVVSIGLRDINTQVNTNSIQLTFDGSPVTPGITKNGALTTVTYDPPGLMTPFVNHNFRIVWHDNAVSPNSKTNQVAFTVAPYVNFTLANPIYSENFDGLVEGTLPAGWSVTNFTDQDIPGYDLNDFRSDAYLDWVVISRSTLSNLFNVVPDGPYFVNTLPVAPNQVINGQLVTNLIDGNFIFAVSDRADNEKQIQYVTTRDYNLAGRTNIYLAFNSIWTQNQDSMAGVEYLINGGTTWLPAQYMLDGPDILRDINGNIDASNTFATVNSDPFQAVPTMTSTTGGNYGLFIGVAQNLWSTLAPYLSARVDDDQFESKRVEMIRLAQADNQTTVRIRFVAVGTYSWFWGIDNFGLYSMTNINPPILTAGPTPANRVAAVGNSTSFTIGSPLGLGPFTYQWRHNGVNLPGKTVRDLVIAPVAGTDAGNYDVVVSNLAGSVTSAPPASVLSVINPAVFVTGQWDFPGSLGATVGRDLEYFDATVQGDTAFGTTTSFGLADINGQPTTVMHFTPSTFPWGGYRAYHGAAPNGGGAYVNQYTVIYDLYYPFNSDLTWRSLWQTDLSNTSDGDVFIGADFNGIGISSVYQGNVTSFQWHRVAFAFDLTGPGEAPVLTKFIDGVKVGTQTTGLNSPDGRFSLDPAALLFADNDGDQHETFVSSVQFSNGRRPDAYIAGLGGPNAAKIAGPITAKAVGGQVIISWPGGVPLESSASVTGPWSIVSGATSPYSVSSPSGSRFYRPKLF